MAIVRPNGNISGDELGNLRRFAAATGLNFVDGIDKNGSLQERGLALNTNDKVFYSDKPQPGNVTIDTIKNHPRFKSATVTENKDGSAQVLFRNGDGFKVDFITDMADKGVKLETSYGNFKKDTSKKVAGAYVEENKTILFNKDRAGIPTIDHEHIHFLEKSGYLDSRDTRILNMGAKRSGFEMTEEGRADFVAQAFQKRDEQVGIVKQVLQKIGDFFDIVMNAVGHRTTGGVLRDIESGKIMVLPNLVYLPKAVVNVTAGLTGVHVPFS